MSNKLLFLVLAATLSGQAFDGGDLKLWYNKPANGNPTVSNADEVTLKLVGGSSVKNCKDISAVPLRRCVAYRESVPL